MKEQTDIEETEDDYLEEDVIYKKDNFLFKAIIFISASVFCILLVLAVIGFIIGLSGGTPPSFDSDIITNRFSDIIGDKDSIIPPNELEKNS